MLEVEDAEARSLQRVNVPPRQHFFLEVPRRRDGGPHFSPANMEELLARHRKEQRDLVSQITQKKKAASKKTRKAVNDECVNLEGDLKARQAKELAELNGGKLALAASPFFSGLRAALTLPVALTRAEQ